MDKRCFVSDKLGTVSELLFIVLLYIKFEVLVICEVHSIPKLRLAQM